MYSQPFYVGRNSRFKGVSIDGYLPALEPSENENLPKTEPEWVDKQWDVVTQIRSEVTGWRGKHAEALLEIDKLRKQVIGKPSRKGKFNKYD